MVKINNKPILIHIMEHYNKFGFNEFYIAIGYKGNVIKKYFTKQKFNWNVKLIKTGLNTMTGGRLKRLKKIIGDETFMMTWGWYFRYKLRLLKFHKRNKKLVTQVRLGHLQDLVQLK